MSSGVAGTILLSQAVGMPLGGTWMSRGTPVTLESVHISTGFEEALLSLSEWSHLCFPRSLALLV